MKQLGDILLEDGLVDEAQLAAAFDEHQRAGRSLGRILVELGVLTEAQLVEALASQIGMHFVDLDDYPVDGTAVALVPGAVCRRYTVLPVGFDEGRLRARDGRPGQRLRRRRRPLADRAGRCGRSSRPATTCSRRSTGSAAPTTRWTT